MKNKIYIAGPMTGLPGLNFAAFDRAETYLKSLGREVVNPANIGRKYGQPDEGMISFAMMMDEEMRRLADECDEIYLLRGWEKSKGALRELELALRHGYKITVENGV